MNCQNKNKSTLKVILLIILLTFQLFAPKISGQTTNSWYVDQDATGLNNGTSWNNAWTSLSGINWASISAGDIIYVSGGIYSETFIFGKSGVAGNLITVSGSYEEGHNDEVIISPSGSTGIQLAGRSYVRVNHLSINGCGIGINVSSGNTIYVDSIKVRNSSDRMFYASGNTGGSWSSNLFIRWCDLQTTASGQADGIYIQWYWENIDIEGNLIVIENTATSHMDGIQWSNYVRNIKVWNNWIQNNTPPSANRDSQGMMLASANGYIYIYNNVIYCPLFNGKSPCIYRTTYQGENGIYYVYNNTLITSGSYDVIRLEVDGATYCKNNIIMDINTPYTGTTNWNGGIAWIWTPDDYSKIDANLFTTSLLTSSTYQIGSNPTQRSMASMYNLGAEHHGSYITRDRVNPLFTTTVTGSLDYNAVNLSLQTGSPAIDGGVNLQLEVEARGMLWESFNNPYIRWANGGSRGSTPDIGAYEYTNGSTATDNTSPNLLGAAVIDPTTIELTFSEAMESAAALNKLNYTINNGIVVNSVSLSTDLKKVTLGTTQNAANQIYTVVVNNVKDLAGNIISSSNNSAQYSYVGDTTPPNLLNAAVINSTTIALLFSEPLETTSAQTKTNYTINNGIVVNSAVLSVDKKAVTLNTTQHTTNQNYTITVSNVKDLAGNIISANNSAQYTFVDNTVGDLKANLKIYLQGPFLSSNMMTELSGNEFLPASQPYNGSPWFYNGTEVLGSGASSSTDWVLVELRSAQDPALVISRRACLLRNDGIIIEPNGTPGVTFKNLLYGSYYIAVFHRSHLAVMTSVPVSFSPDNSLYDFTNALSKAYGQNAMAEITTGIFGMYAGDGDGNGTINDIDRGEIWSNQNGTMGYLNGDFNLDTGVTVKDINDYWNFNKGKVTQVP